MGVKGLFWNLGYAYIRSMGKDRVFVENTHSFFVHNHGPSMDRNWRGSIPRTSRYRTAIDRERPDPHDLFVQRAVPRVFLYARATRACFCRVRTL